jgi:hypothetical protein
MDSISSRMNWKHNTRKQACLQGEGTLREAQIWTNCLMIELVKAIIEKGEA